MMARFSADRTASRPGIVRRTVAALAVSAMLAVQSIPASAQGKLPLIRDAEIESLIRDYATPIFRAAGVAGSNPQIFLLNSREFNAFVADGRRMFINVGALMQTDTPNQIIGVIAHETGHIAGGHLARMREQFSRTQTAVLVAMLLGLAAAAAGSSAGVPGVGQAGQAAILGGRQVAERSFLAYRRTEEQAADRAAVNYLAATGQSAEGMLQIFEKFSDQAIFTSKFADPYVISHPMPADRIASLENLVRSSPYQGRRDPPELQARHDMMRAKLSGFLESPQAVFRRYPTSDTSLPARYARAIARYRTADIRKAVADIDGLIKSQSRNPYFWELKGQALLESGRPKEAIEPLRQASRLAPGSGLIAILYGQALVASNDDRYLGEAIDVLRRASNSEPDASNGFRQLALAYGRTGRNADASLASARAYFAEGSLKLAKQQAARAKKLFKRGSPGWLQADDILNVKEPKRSRRRS